MPVEFDKMGVRFQYPENWKLDEADALAGNKSVTVYAPDGGAFWSVSLHPRKTNPADLTAAAVAAMREEYPDVEADPVEETLFEQPVVGYDLYFYCFDFVTTASVRSWSAAKGNFVIFYQAEDREFDQFRDVFSAMTFSLINALR